MSLDFRSRSSDPITSHEAAANAVRFAGSHAERICAALEKLQSATAHELSEETGLTVVQVDRRLPELERAGKAYVLTMAGKAFVRDGFRVWAKVF
jgi:hypothetical protein